jgi:myo-inositol-1(or 4)-monophosphatase
MHEHSSEFTFVAIQAALSAGDLLRSGFGTQFNIESKEGKQNLVTEFDKASEKQIISSLLQKFPHHSILAEESGNTKQNKSKVTWIIDPLDGTVNFAHNIPIFSISIAAVEDKEVVCGVVYQPMTQELFIAEKGKGAYLNGKQLLVSKTAQFESALMATGFPYNVDQNPLHCVDKFAQMQTKGVPIRRLGSAAIDLAYVAAGRFDAFWEVGLHSWDMAAGKLLVEEAGGTVTHWNGSKHQIFGYDTLVATNGHLHKAMVSYLNE